MTRASAFILAAGFGTRLRPLTEHRPKPLAPVCGVPLLNYALALVHQHGHSHAIVNAHHLAEQLQAFDGIETEGVCVRVSTELPEILGTGGGLKHVRDELAERVVVVNADVLCDIDLDALIQAVPQGGSSMALRPNEQHAKTYGMVAADETGAIIKMRDIASAEPHGMVRWDTHFTGVHALHRDCLDRVPDGFACIVRSAYKELVPLRQVQSIRHRGTWLDIGNPSAYLAANMRVLTTRLSVPLNPADRASFVRSPRGNRGETAATVRGRGWIGEGATVDGAVLEDSIIGHGAQVSAGANLKRCVVWDGVKVPEGDWADGIFHDGGWLAIAEE